ncbi:hypothetical protein AGMMS4957_18840 [Bacteroidia bacterium]|nr:hypothetical protein AGMMS4957_18840 [Bacteroidia bacterium]
MKKKFLVSIAIFFLNIFGMKTQAQGISGHVTPQTADFVKYGETPVSLFAGKMNLEVPIYRIKDRDFDIPISLIYTSDGFKPEKRSDLVGLDWTLKAGGCITREVYGTPDDSKLISSEQEMGYLATLQRTNYSYPKDKVWNFDPSIVLPDNSFQSYYLKYVDGCFVDYQPDLFMFNFNGHTGHFMINSDGTAIANDKGYKVDISGLTIQNIYQNSAPQVSTLKITAPDGYIYEFGGLLDKLEYSISFRQGTMLTVGTVNPVILAWHLSKITAPNGRMVNFNYLTADIGSINTTSTKQNPIWQSGKGTLTEGISAAQATKKAIIESIEVDNVKIEFKKSIETTLITNGSDNGVFFLDHADFNRASYQLDNIIIKYNTTPLYKYKLTYENKNKRRFLSSVIQPNGSKYEFTSHKLSLPQCTTSNRHLWLLDT